MPAFIGAELRDAAGRLAASRSWPVLSASGLLLLACNVTDRLGHRAVLFKHVYPRAYVLVLLLVLAAQLHRVPASAWRDLRALAIRASLPFAALVLIVGVSALVSNGTTYADMASNYWQTDPFGSTSRRIGLPVLANVLGFERNGYVFFWYAALFASVTAASALLESGRLLLVERLSLLTASILAYALIGPGYSEIAVLALGCLALMLRLGTTGKVVLATMMLATHETATALTALAIVAASEGDERSDWIVVFGALYALYVAAYLFVWRGETLHALFTASKPSPGATDTSPQLAFAHPAWTLLGIFLAYKLYWILVPAGMTRRETRSVAMAALVSLVLAVIGTDTSRLVEFSTLAVLVLATRILPEWPRRLRLGLAVLNLIVPSLYVATNAEALWGRGLYSAYLYGARAAGLDWGRPFASDPD